MQISNRTLRTLATRVFLTAGSCAVVALILTGMASSTAYASQAASKPPPYTLTLRATQAPTSARNVILTATVSPQGKPASGAASQLAGIAVDFYVGTAQFTGQFGNAPLLLLGKSATGSNGVATLTYSPTWTGKQPLVAQIDSASGNTLVSSSTTYSATAASSPFKGTVQSQRPDGTLGKWAGGILLAILGLLWLVLFGTAVRVNILFKATHHGYAR